MKLHLLFAFVLLSLPAAACQEPGGAPPREPRVHERVRIAERAGEPQQRAEFRERHGRRQQFGPRHGPAFCPHCGAPLRRMDRGPRGPRTRPGFAPQRGPGARPGRGNAPQHPRTREHERN